MDKKELGKMIKEAAYLEGDFILRSGKRSKYYLDKYLFSTKPQILKPLAEEISRALPQNNEYDYLAGPELGAVAIVSAVSLVVGKPFIIVRKVEKEYGTKKLFEGQLEKGKKVVIIEDVLTTGGAALKSAIALRDWGAGVVEIIGVVDREEGARENIEKEGFKMKAVFTKADLGI